MYHSKNITQLVHVSASQNSGTEYGNSLFIVSIYIPDMNNH